MLCGHVRVVKATGGRLGPEACPGHWLVPSNRLSSQLSGWGPLVRAVRAPVLVVAVEPLAGQQEEDLARGRDGSTSIPLSSTVSHFFSSPAASLCLPAHHRPAIRHTKASNCPFQRAAQIKALSLPSSEYISPSNSVTKKGPFGFYVNFAGARGRRSSSGLR